MVATNTGTSVLGTARSDTVGVKTSESSTKPRGQRNGKFQKLVDEAVTRTETNRKKTQSGKADKAEKPEKANSQVPPEVAAILSQILGDAETEPEAIAGALNLPDLQDYLAADGTTLMRRAKALLGEMAAILEEETAADAAAEAEELANMANMADAMDGAKTAETGKTLLPGVSEELQAALRLVPVTLPQGSPVASAAMADDAEANAKAIEAMLLSAGVSDTDSTSEGKGQGEMGSTIEMAASTGETAKSKATETAAAQAAFADRLNAAMQTEQTATATTATPAKPAPAYSQLAQELRDAIAQKAPVELQLKLQPESLGEVSVKMVWRGEKLAIDIIAASASTQKLLHGQVDKLIATLGLQNAQVESVQVSQAASAQSFSGQPQDQAMAFFMNLAQKDRGEREAGKGESGPGGKETERIADFGQAEQENVRKAGSKRARFQKMDVAV